MMSKETKESIEFTLTCAAFVGSMGMTVIGLVWLWRAVLG